MLYFAFPVAVYTLPIMMSHSNGSTSVAGFVVEVGLESLDHDTYSILQLWRSDFFRRWNGP
jgi:hypothetical protein